MKNELVIINRIEKRLRERRPDHENIFPLTPTHRKELRQLKSENMGGLRDRLRTLKMMKQEEYCKKYSNQIAKEFEKHKKEAKELNLSWQNMADSIRKQILKHKGKEDILKGKIPDLHIDYEWDCNICQLQTYKSKKRTISVDSKQVGETIAKKEFDDKFSMAFQKVDEKLDDLNTKYEEAINFGDLELVKELYYILKNSDSIFEKIKDMEI